MTVPVEDDESSSGHALFQSGPSAIGPRATVLEDPFDSLSDEFDEGAGSQRVQEDAPSSLFERFLSGCMALSSASAFKHMDDDFDEDLNKRRANPATLSPEEERAIAAEENMIVHVLGSEESSQHCFLRAMFLGALGAYCFWLLKQARIQWVATDSDAVEQREEEEEQEDEPEEDVWGCSRLHAAAAEGDAVGVEALLCGHVCVDAREAWGETALHMAARQGSSEVCALLLAHGADVNAANDSDETPLLIAAKAGNRAVCARILDSGAGVGGVTPDDLPPLLNALLVERMMLGLAKSSTPDRPAST